MGENPADSSRSAVRPRCSGRPGRNSGFSTAEPKPADRPDGDRRLLPHHANVADQPHDPDSLLNFIRLLDHPPPAPARSSAGASSRSSNSPHVSVLAHRLTWDDASLVGATQPEPGRGDSCRCRSPEPVRAASWSTCSSRAASPSDGTTALRGGRLDGYGYRWLRCCTRAIGGCADPRSGFDQGWTTAASACSISVFQARFDRPPASSSAPCASSRRSDNCD